ncbi:alpha/beta fold hydrolase [Mycetocola reblochoni]|uniref:Alpha/beta hydrolase n=2 Tax=Mycetocola reblochoni TaxID=331618 RepID=A0A3L6ZMQ0_9MICO|nr:alpha/beta hydrolase [Mycetocola reblochoni]RLP68945.1 alpha/beta hydrolase [Mycetocola reblochoni]SJN16107.1 putative hydrolase [Mycetocola reblochoni REB411]
MSRSVTTVPLAGCTLHLTDIRPDRPSANGREVLMLHGAGMDGTVWEHQARALAADGHRVVVPDLRGHGASRPAVLPPTAERLLADTAAVVDVLRLDRPVLVGHSLGGNLAQALVRSDPRGFSGLAVLDSAWNAGPLTRAERLALALAGPGLRLVPSRRLAPLLARASAETPPARAACEAAFARLSRDEFLAAWTATTPFLSPDPGHRTPLPLLLVRGDRDRTGTIATSMPSWARAESVAEHVVPGAGHVVMLDAPEATAAVLRGFVETIDGG